MKLDRTGFRSILIETAGAVVVGVILFIIFITCSSMIFIMIIAPIGRSPPTNII